MLGRTVEYLFILNSWSQRNNNTYLPHVRGLLTCITRTGQFTMPILSIFWKENTNFMSLHVWNRTDCNIFNVKSLPCKYQTRMFVLRDTVLSNQTKLDCARQHLSGLVSVKLVQLWDHCQQIDRTISIVHLSHHISLLSIYKQRQYLHMYYIHLAVSKEKTAVNLQENVK